MLGQVAQRCRSEGEAGLALALEGQPADQVAVQAGHEVDVTGIGLVLPGGQDAGHVELGLATDLVGAGIDNMGGWSGLRAVPPFDHKRRKPEP